MLFKIFGYKFSSNLGYFIGKTFGPLFRSKKLVIDNLKKSGISLKKIIQTQQMRFLETMEEYLLNIHL